MTEEEDVRYAQGGYIPGGPVPAMIHPGEQFYTAEQVKAATAAAGWHWPDAKIVTVTDGDTIDAQVTRDIGFGGSCTFRVRLRLARINAPSSKTEPGKASAAWLTGLLTGQTVDLVTLDAYAYGGPRYSPGEWMAEVVLADGRNVSDLSVSLGFSVLWDGHGPRPGG